MGRNEFGLKKWRKIEKGTVRFSGETERRNANFHRLGGGNDGREACFSMSKKHSQL
jgi:hypothetical protein